MLLSAFLIFNIIYLPLSLPKSKFRYAEANRQIQEGKQRVVGTHLLTHIEHSSVPSVSLSKVLDNQNNFLILFANFLQMCLVLPHTFYPWLLQDLGSSLGAALVSVHFLVIQNGPFLPGIILIPFHHDPGCSEATPYFVVARTLDLPNRFLISPGFLFPIT